MPPGTTALGPGQVRDANRPMLAAAARQAGAAVLDLGIARDEEAAVAAAFDAAVASSADVMLITGVDRVMWEWGEGHVPGLGCTGCKENERPGG